MVQRQKFSRQAGKTRGKTGERLSGPKFSPQTSRQRKTGMAADRTEKTLIEARQWEYVWTPYGVYAGKRIPARHLNAARQTRERVRERK
jgi:hypothetical protein